jgi:hypothetical protein
MTTIKQPVSTIDIQAEIRGIRETVKKICSSREAARKFLASTGMYTAAGQLKPQFR